MANLLVRDVDDTIVMALKARAKQEGVSVEAAHRKILEEALLKPVKKSFEYVIASIPNVGRDTDFERAQGDGADCIKDGGSIF